LVVLSVTHGGSFNTVEGGSFTYNTGWQFLRISQGSSFAYNTGRQFYI